MFLEGFQEETGLEMTWRRHSWRGKGGNETQDWVAGWYVTKRRVKFAPEGRVEQGLWTESSGKPCPRLGSED